MAQHNESASILAPLLLLVAALVGFILANSPLASLWDGLLQTDLEVNVGGVSLLDKPFLLLINDGLMAIFFLFVGLELKREIVAGGLSDIRQAILPVASAIGGMVVPAAIYLALNGSDTTAMKGWAVPMATDIAFALGILAILGSRVPAALKVILAAVAIVDDLGAILVIALFYTSSIDATSLFLALSIFAVCIAANALGMMKISFYLIMGIPFWYFTLKSGIHATIAGVLLAMVIPLAPATSKARQLVEAVMSNEAPLHTSPAIWLERALIGWVGSFIIPVFALSNAGVGLGEASVGTVAWGIILGLVVGKPLGIFGAAKFVEKMGWAKLPEGVSWGHILAIGFLGGVGFTMSLFISSLGFAAGAMNSEARLAILMASIFAAFAGVITILVTSRGTRGVTDIETAASVEKRAGKPELSLPSS